jgi:hypothetical protein
MLPHAFGYAAPREHFVYSLPPEGAHSALGAALWAV